MELIWMPYFKGLDYFATSKSWSDALLSAVVDIPLQLFFDSSVCLLFVCWKINVDHFQSIFVLVLVSTFSGCLERLYFLEPDLNRFSYFRTKK